MRKTSSIKSVVDALDADRRYRQGEMLRWMLSEALHAMGLPHWEKIPDQAKDQVSEALHAYERAVACEEPFTDLLGTIYMDLVSRWGKSVLGQYFTPQCIARMMAEMTYKDERPAPGRLLTACDPAVGSGVMMLSLLQSVLERQGSDALLHWSVTGVDIDPVCVRMYALQVVANCAIHRVQVGEVVAYHGNALGPESGLKVILHATAPTVTNVVPAAHPQRIKAVEKVVKQRQLEQLSLFEEMVV